MIFPRPTISRPSLGKSTLPMPLTRPIVAGRLPPKSYLNSSFIGVRCSWWRIQLNYQVTQRLSSRGPRALRAGRKICLKPFSPCATLDPRNRDRKVARAYHQVEGSIRLLGACLTKVITHVQCPRPLRTPAKSSISKVFE